MHSRGVAIVILPYTYPAAHKLRHIDKLPIPIGANEMKS